MINNKGYRIPIDSLEITSLKKELSVSPFIPGNKFVQKYLMYRTSDNYFYMPKYFGINKFGVPQTVTEQEGIKHNVLRLCILPVMG